MHFGPQIPGLVLALIVVTGCDKKAVQDQAIQQTVTNYPVAGVLKQISPDGRTVVVQHEEVTDYMPAMTMPFNVRQSNELNGLRSGDRVSFRLSVTADESWIDQIKREGIAATHTETLTNAARPQFALTNIPNFSFTNEFGQPVSLRDFSGKAIALTFFFTRCPIPEYCPRLMQNFSKASRTLLADRNAPSNWHFLAISFDPFDTPAVLRTYAPRYNYNSNHWSFLTGRNEQMLDLARGFGVKVSGDPGSYSHGFATIVFDAQGRLQARWPVGGDTSDALVKEIIKGASATNSPALQ